MAVHRAICSGDEVESRGSKKEQALWYAMRVRSGFEFVVSLSLRQKGYEEFLPFYRSRRAWSDRIKEIDVPLFPGYIFCRFDASAPYCLLITPGVMNIVSAGRKLLPVEEGQLACIRTICRAGLHPAPWPFLPSGLKVRVEHGPLAGTEGIVVEQKGAYRIVVSVTILQRSVSAEIERTWVRPLKERNP